MDAFYWSKDLETGNHQIDFEHKALVNKINHVLEACHKGQGKEEVATALQFLHKYTKEHFAHEETLQRQSGYPDFQRHKALHHKFVKDIEELERCFERGDNLIVLACEINSSIGCWIINHIKQEDKKLAAYLHSKGKVK